jgi:two-component system sensor histidine kinase PilS (NtrC family)
MERQRGKLLGVFGVRIGFFIAILGITFAYQFKQTTFFNTESLFPILGALCVAFTLNSIYLSLFDRLFKYWQPMAVMFAFDALFITALIYFTGIQQSIFLFLYLVNIILCGFVFQRKGAFVLALFTSTCFSFLLVLAPEIQGQALFYAVGLNNLAFFSVATLSGYLSEQLSFMGTELKAKKKDIRALTDLNKIIVENISSGLVTISTDFQILLSNKAAQKILGVFPEAGREVDSVFPGMRDLIKAREKQRLEGRAVESRLERRHQSPQGDRIILGLSVSPLEDEEKVVSGYIIIFQDLTEIVRLEGAMRRQEKLAAVGKLAAGIAHEIRNPLASISGSIELLRAILPATTADQVKLMDIMLKEINRLNLLITEFLDFVRPEQQTTELCDVSSILNEVMDMVKLNPQLPTNVEQKRSLKAKGRVLGSKNKLKQVFLNLAINAYQAMTDRVPAILKVETWNDGGHIFVRFSDSGAGMSEATQKRLFEPFFTTKPKGTGLGLATAHKILETYDAKIFVESHEGQGTEFTIQFQQAMTTGELPHEGQNTGS